jgi:hypothetical protein
MTTIHDNYQNQGSLFPFGQDPHHNPQAPVGAVNQQNDPYWQVPVPSRPVLGSETMRMMRRMTEDLPPESYSGWRSTPSFPLPANQARPWEIPLTGVGEASAEGGPIPVGTKPLGLQIGGSHYKQYKIQPVEYIHANNIGFLEGCIIKYITRWRHKDGLKDLQKAKHFIDLLIELEELEKNNNKPVSNGP